MRTNGERIKVDEQRLDNMIDELFLQQAKEYTFRARIRFVKKNKRLTQKQIARGAGCTTALVGHYCRYNPKKTPPPSKGLEAIANVLEVDLEWLRNGKALDLKALKYFSSRCIANSIEIPLIKWNKTYQYYCDMVKSGKSDLVTESTKMIPIPKTKKLCLSEKSSFATEIKNEMNYKIGTQIYVSFVEKDEDVFGNKVLAHMGQSILCGTLMQDQNNHSILKFDNTEYRSIVLKNNDFVFGVIEAILRYELTR